MAHNQKAEALAQRLRVLRAEKGLSLTEVAELTKVHRDTVSALERGKRHPYKPTLKKLARVYGVPLGELMEPEAVSDELSINDIAVVGRYALNFRWSDGHETGIYSFRYLRGLCEEQQAEGSGQ